jgi:LIM domain kinase 1
MVVLTHHPLLLDSASHTRADYSTTVIRSHPSQRTDLPSSSMLTIRSPLNPSKPDNSMFTPGSNITADLCSIASTENDTVKNPGMASLLSIDSFQTANSSSIISVAAATEGGSTIRTSPRVHRFTLIKPGAKRANGNGSQSSTGRINGRRNGAVDPSEHQAVGWSPLDLLFSSGLLVAKCDICTKRLGWKPVLECDDCGLRLVERSRPPNCRIIWFLITQITLHLRRNRPNGLWSSRSRPKVKLNANFLAFAYP